MLDTGITYVGLRYPANQFVVSVEMQVKWEYSTTLQFQRSLADVSKRSK